MVARVLFGARSSALGLWISKATKNVLTAADADLLFSSERVALQVLQSSSMSVASRSATAGIRDETVTHADYGFQPLVLLEFIGFTDAEYMTGWNVGTWGYNLQGRTNTSFTYWRPDIVISDNYKAFTLNYRLLSLGTGNL